MANFEVLLTNVLAAEHPIVQMFSCACWTFFLKEHTPSDIQLRVFRALWEIGGSPTDPTVLRALEELALEHPLTGLQVFLLSLKDAH